MLTNLTRTGTRDSSAGVGLIHRQYCRFKLGNFTLCVGLSVGPLRNRFGLQALIVSLPPSQPPTDWGGVYIRPCFVSFSGSPWTGVAMLKVFGQVSQMLWLQILSFFLETRCPMSVPLLTRWCLMKRLRRRRWRRRRWRTCRWRRRWQHRKSRRRRPNICLFPSATSTKLFASFNFNIDL